MASRVPQYVEPQTDEEWEAEGRKFGMSGADWKEQARLSREVIDEIIREEAEEGLK